MEFEKKINVGHLIVAASLLVSIVLYTSDIRTSIGDEAHARDTADNTFSAEMKRVSEILTQIQAEQRLNTEHRIKDEAHWSE